MGPQFNVMISTTIRGLQEHRKLVMDACLRQRMFPLMMEHLPASDADAISISLRLVSEANLYVLIVGYRYGYVPKDQLISITEMEYNHAVELNIPRLVFLMHEEHLIKAAEVEVGAGASKLEDFKTRLKNENIVNFFKSPEGLRADIINSLSQYRRDADLPTFHYVGEIPTAPEAFIAHPYTLMQTHNWSVAKRS